MPEADAIDIGTSFTLRGAAVLDEAGGFSGPQDVGVENGVITAMAPSLPRSAASMDARGQWLMPGVIDCHSHLALTALASRPQLTTPITRWAIEAARNASVTLAAGVTFVRDAGGLDAGVRSSIDDGLVQGPTVQISIVPLTQTGGHVDGWFSGPGLESSVANLFPDYPGRPPFRVDGVDAMCATVRQLLRAGADWIKLCTTGGVLSEGDALLDPEFSPEEIQMAVTEAARRRKSVFTHAYGGPGIDNAVRAGVRSIEHGTFLTETQAAAMAKTGCWLVPTLSVLDEVIGMAKHGKLPPEMGSKALQLEATLGEAVRIARAHGVRVALGTDANSTAMHGRNLREIELLCRYGGMSVEEALLTATLRGAELCGVAATRGRIAPGYIFDAILLGADPSDPTVFADPFTVRQVFKAGVAVRRDTALN
ncbi:MAG TPA: amidohydrolase family protein [Bauldia sp.]|nr:amidohydrolase family protein [Bauldia sp.]